MLYHLCNSLLHKSKKADELLIEKEQLAMIQEVEQGIQYWASEYPIDQIPWGHNILIFKTYTFMKTTKRLIIEKIEPADFQRFYEINADPQTNVYNPHGAMNHETAQEVFEYMLKHWEDHGFGIWKIAEKTKPHYSIGFGGLSNRKYGDELRLNIGFRFDKQYWGKAYATEFAQAAIQYGFTDLKKSSIFGLVRPQNLASVRVLEKCNMLLWGRLADVPNQADSLVYRVDNA